VLLFAYALFISVMVPTWFLLAGPVRERRALVGLTYAALFVLAWCAALLLGFLSPLALSAGAAALATLGAGAAYYSHRDERLLARFDARIGDPDARAVALFELRARVREIGNEGDRIVALMEVASFPIRRLLDRCLFDEARAFIDMIDGDLGPRLGRADASELNVLSARCYMHASQPEEALTCLSAARAIGGAPSEEIDVLDALHAAVRRDVDRAERLLERAAVPLWSGRLRDLAALAAAHVAALRGQEARAIAELRSIRPEARASMSQLARAMLGPASELAEHLERPSSPYR
jgi:hypothetical protein